MDVLKEPEQYKIGSEITRENLISFVVEAIGTGYGYAIGTGVFIFWHEQNGLFNLNKWESFLQSVIGDTETLNFNFTQITKFFDNKAILTFSCLEQYLNEFFSKEEINFAALEFQKQVSSTGSGFHGRLRGELLTIGSKLGNTTSDDINNLIFISILFGFLRQIKIARFNQIQPNDNFDTLADEIVGGITSNILTVNIENYQKVKDLLHAAGLKHMRLMKETGS